MTQQDWLTTLIIAIVNTLFLFFASGKFLLAMQQCSYRNGRYFRWLYSKKNQYLSRLMLLSLLGFLFAMLLGPTFASIMPIKYAQYFGFLSYAFFIVVYIHTERHVTAKLPLKITKRMLRLTIVNFLITFAVSFAITLGLTYSGKGDMTSFGRVYTLLKYSFIALTPLLAPFILILSNGVVKPLESRISDKYIKRTKKLLDDSRLIKIGITGSYGKTSVKEILKTLLSVKYRVLATPESYNTPLGISFAVKDLDSTYDVFIAEMGAREVGDISDLAKLVNPDVAVLTGVNSQHLETFKSLENIKNTKYELFENLKEGGKAFFDVNCDVSKELSQKFNGEKYLIGEGSNFVCAQNIKTVKEGVVFDLVIEGEQPEKCFTTLIGKHSIRNILLAVGVAYKLGLSVREIAFGISRIHSIKHRLEVLPNNKGVTLIDDSYNSNTDGVKCALDAMLEFDGRKIIVTPGLVELGANQNDVNYALGKLIYEKCEIMIISAKHNAVPLINGFVDAGGSKENILFAPSHTQAQKLLDSILKEGDVVLFENDLPDIYD